MQLFAFVNRKSGSRAGRKIFDWLSQQNLPVYDLHGSNDLKAFISKIRAASKQKKERVVVIAAGGDGTISSVGEMLANNKIDAAIAPFPLGTGNELAYNAGWGGYFTDLRLDDYFVQFERAPVHEFDVWHAHTISEKGEPRVFRFQSFFSLGMDARVVYSHALLQKKFPALYRFRFMSLIWYVVFGVYEAFLRRIRIGKYLKISCGNQEILAPRAGIIHILNIPTSGGHTDYFGHDLFEKKPPAGYAKPSVADGMLEVSATEGIRSFLKSVLKLGPVTRLGQVRQLELTADVGHPQRIQVDGEKVDELMVEIKIRHAGKQKILLGPGRRRGC